MLLQYIHLGSESLILLIELINCPLFVINFILFYIIKSKRKIKNIKARLLKKI